MRFGRRTFAAGALLSCNCILAATQQGAGVAAPIEREIIPGSELMTSQERERYRARIRAAGTPDAQARERERHVQQMRERARLRGLELADPKRRDTQ